MNKFIETYLNIIEEAKFKDIKWKFDLIFKDIEIFENFEHLNERLKERYKLEFETWIYWETIKRSIIDYLLKENAWLHVKKKAKYQKMYSVYLTVSDMWVGFIIQNDLEDKVKRIYFSTFLPNEEIKIHPHVTKFDLPL